MNRRLPAIQSYWLMLIATIITIAIVTASQLITQRIGLLLDRQASELLAADLVVASSAPLAQSYREKAGAEGLNVATTISMRTAIFIDDEPQLVELKAAGAGYPLRGQLETARDLNAEKQRPKQGPSNGEVWIDTRLSAQLGQSILLGKQSFEANWLLTFEPDRGGSLFNLAPRVLMNLDDLHDTGL
ncbi:MAG: ABC transporter permease, partial [Proteobacteria bacterium]|nr:ABC transporter permease [Pseudomonadota bacterium]